jgi:hypothetical protein
MSFKFIQNQKYSEIKVNFAALELGPKTDRYTDLQIISGKRNFNFIYIQNNRECEETKFTFL